MVSVEDKEEKVNWCQKTEISQQIQKLENKSSTLTERTALQNLHRDLDKVRYEESI